jgi:hypothetical protein
MAVGNAVLFSGYAKLPAGTVSGEIYKVMALVVLLDNRTGEVVEADCTLSTRLAERFVKSLLVGRNISHDSEAIIQQINTVYQGSAKKAIINAWRIICTKYANYNQEHNLN